MKEPTISLVMIVKNEEEFLKECLASVSELTTEMIIVDTGSTDDTKNIAHSFNAKIFNYVWRDDFSEARNFALEHATSDWILHLDADEELIQEDTRLLKKLIKDDSVFAYMTQIIDTEISEIFPSTRLFKNGKGFFYTGQIHENIDLSLQSYDKEHFAFSDIRILHKGYAGNVIQMKNKQARNLALLKKIENEQPGDLKNLMDLAVQYHAMKDFKTAIDYLKTVITTGNSQNAEPPEVYKYLIQCFQALKDPASAIAVADQGIARFPRYSDIIFLQGIDLFMTKQYVRAINNFQRCLQIDKNTAMPTLIPGSQGILSELFLNLAIYENTRNPRIYQTLDKLMVSLSRDIDALLFLGKHYKTMYGIDYAKKEMDKIADKKNPAVNKVLELLFPK